MKKFKWFLGLCVAALLFAGCYNQDLDEPDIPIGRQGEVSDSILAAQKFFNEKDADNKEVWVAFYVEGKSDYSDREAYVWISAGDVVGSFDNAELDGCKFGVIKLTGNSKLPDDVKTALEDNSPINIIPKMVDSWDWKTPDLKLPITATDKHFMIVSGAESLSSCTISALPKGDEKITPKILSATSKSKRQIEAELSVTYALDISASDNGFTVVAKGVKDPKGDDVITVVDVQNAESMEDRYRNNARKIVVTLQKDMDTSKTWILRHDGFDDKEIDVKVASKDLAESTEDAASKLNDLGLTLNGTTATFKIWAPVASGVTLLLYADAADVGTFNADAIEAKAVGSTTDKELEGTPISKDGTTMKKDPITGVWTATNIDVSNAKYYKYKIVNGGETYYVADINAKAASADAIASQIVDITKDANAMPDGGWETAYVNPWEGSSYADAVIYEMNITDWSNAAESKTDVNVGKYLTVANSKKVIAHIKELGVTHVQILPVFEFAETVANTDYNWGYNPYHYNVPETRYVVDMTDGTDAVKQLRTLIKAFHDEGIAVNMDVVYNHTNGTQGGSLYDSTVPSYYYRFDGAGNYADGTGCGNEVDTEALMSKKYIIDSLMHWMNDYHFNGFRFDLMGCISKSTMEEIYEALYKIDPKVMVYGEPWNVSNPPSVTDIAVQAIGVEGKIGVGAFDDDFRDAIKGVEYGGFKKGQVQGVFNDDGIIKGLKGLSGNNNRNDTEKIELALHYVECHDNYTLFDKLAMSYLNKTSFKGDLFARLANQGEDALKNVKKQNMLAAAYVFLSQGTPFINGGQEFLRTKRGNEDSYNTNASGTNAISLDFADKYSDVYNTYKGLIMLRKDNPKDFRAITKDVSAETLKDKDGKAVTGVIKYTTPNFLVYFNATDKAIDITTTGYTKEVKVSSGRTTESATLPTKVDAKSFVILKK